MRARTPEDVGLLIRERRRELGLDQRELARRAGVSRQWIIDLEGGKAGVALGLVMRTAQVLGLAFEVAAPRMPQTKKAGERGQSVSELDALISQLDHLPPPRKGKRG